MRATFFSTALIYGLILLSVTAGIDQNKPKEFGNTGRTAPEALAELSEVGKRLEARYANRLRTPHCRATDALARGITVQPGSGS